MTTVRLVLVTLAASSMGARLMLCLAMRSPRATALLRKASRLAGRLNPHWLVLHVRTEQERPDHIDAQSLRHFATCRSSPAISERSGTTSSRTIRCWGSSSWRGPTA